MQPREDGSCRDLEPAPRGLLGEPARIRRQIPVRTQLDPLVPGPRHLVEEAPPGHLERVLGEPDPPGIGRRTDADAGERGHRGLRNRGHHPTIRKAGQGVNRR
ncbi:putative IolE protein [Streptomyces sp. Tu6071]|nr:putative IolE protein [Streptomyces sp. Tu6071]